MSGIIPLSPNSTDTPPAASLDFDREPSPSIQQHGAAAAALSPQAQAQAQLPHIQEPPPPPPPHRKTTKVSFSETPPNIYNYQDSAIVSSSEEDLPATLKSCNNQVFFKNPDYRHTGTGTSIPTTTTTTTTTESSLPIFNSRPLNDTPVASVHSSPAQAAYSPPPLDTTDSQNSSSDEDKNLHIAKQNTQRNKDIPLLDLDVDVLLREDKLKQKLATTLDIPGQTRSKVSPDGRIAKTDVGSKLVIVMVGLPARGKSYITNKLTRYLNWLQHNTQVFNVGNTRRRVNADVGPEKKPLPDSPLQTDSGNTSPDSMHPQAPQQVQPIHETQHKASFFSPDNKLTTALREKWAMDTLDELLDSLIDGDLSVGIFDATNSTKARRAKLLHKIRERSNGELKVLFLESICSDPTIIDENVRLKLSGPDYKDIDPKIALEDFYGRLRNYEKAYEEIGDDEEKIKGFSYIKMIDVGKKVVTFNVEGFLASQTVYFLLNFNLAERQIWITRHGESHDNVLGRIGGDAPLTERGIRFSKALAEFMCFKKQEFRKKQLERFKTRLEVKIKNHASTVGEEALPDEPLFTVWTSMLQRAIQTAQFFPDDEFFIKEMRMLDELGAGRCDGMTYPEIQAKYPQDYRSRLKNKMTYRYPGVGGESYLDVINRLRPVITEVERCTDHVLIVTHRVISRVLLGYFLNLDKSLVGELDVPLHTVYCLEPKPYGVEYVLYRFDEQANWFKKVDVESLTNLKKVEQVNISFKERQYSVIPTAPSGQVFKKINPGTYTDSLQRSRGIPQPPAQLEVDKLTEKLQNLHNQRK